MLEQSVIAVQRCLQNIETSCPSLVQLPLNAEEVQPVRCGDIAGEVAGRPRAQDQEARVREPVAQ